MINEAHEEIVALIAAKVRARNSCSIVGLCGAQGSGKSTLAPILEQRLEAQGLLAIVLSIDDLYLTRQARTELGRCVHPLLQTRGVPGTHDVELGLKVLDALREPGTVEIPSFDKSRDDRRPRGEWPQVDAPKQVILLEGWCVGAVAQDAASLATPVNALERDLDAEGVWRRYVNEALAGRYQRLFARLDLLILLKAPDFEVVYEWRLEQEHKLREQVLAQGGDLSRVMNDLQVRHFVSHYERLTRHILGEMPGRADMVLYLDSKRKITNIARAAG